MEGGRLGCSEDEMVAARCIGWLCLFLPCFAEKSGLTWPEEESALKLKEPIFTNWGILDLFTFLRPEGWTLFYIPNGHNSVAIFML